MTLAGCALGSANPATAQSGTQIINGTKVFTQIFPADKLATFSNDCGSQTLTQRELQQGAIPNLIIPCPRPGVRVPAPQPKPPEKSEAAERKEKYEAFKKAYEESLKYRDDVYRSLNSGDFRSAYNASILMNTDRSWHPVEDFIERIHPGVGKEYAKDLCIEVLLGIISKSKYTNSDDYCEGAESDNTASRLMEMARKSTYRG
ncbi:hypothetical protein GCM10007884_47450 [Methylobacterium brachythecii]|nr:hypothetical protein GCM10007884_47450 [Methylobacterium brachythecii]